MTVAQRIAIVAELDEAAKLHAMHSKFIEHPDKTVREAFGIAGYASRDHELWAGDAKRDHDAARARCLELRDALNAETE